MTGHIKLSSLLLQTTNHITPCTRAMATPMSAARKQLMVKRKLSLPVDSFPDGRYKRSSMKLPTIDELTIKDGEEDEIRLR